MQWVICVGHSTDERQTSTLIESLRRKSFATMFFFSILCKYQHMWRYLQSIVKIFTNVCDLLHHRSGKIKLKLRRSTKIHFGITVSASSEYITLVFRRFRPIYNLSCPYLSCIVRLHDHLFIWEVRHTDNYLCLQGEISFTGRKLLLSALRCLIVSPSFKMNVCLQRKH